MGGEFDDVTRSMTIDELGNVYTTGRFKGIVDFDPGIGVYDLTASGSTDMFISKIDTYGNFIWAKRFGGNSAVVSYSIKLDNLGNIYNTGHFDSTTDFDPGFGVFNLNSSGYFDVFVSKLDNDGNFLWAKKMGGSNQNYGTEVGLDDLGNIYLTGHFRETVDFDPGVGTFNLTSSGDLDVFVTKLDEFGDFVWARKIGGSGSDLTPANLVDGPGNIYYTGSFLGTVDFDPSILVNNFTSSGNEDIFITKLDAEGNFKWAKTIGSVSVDKGWKIDLDASNNLYITGNFTEIVDFDPDAGVFNLTSAGNEDVFILKLDSLGNFIWAIAMGGLNNDIGKGISIDNHGDVYTIGNFQETADLDPSSATFNLTSFGSDDIFISKLDSSGNFIWAVQLGGSSVENAISIEIDEQGYIYTAGDFQGSVDFDQSNETFNLTSAGSSDFFIQKMSQSLSLSISNNSISCFGAENGSAWVSTFNGIPPYSYLWSPGGSTNDTIFNLSPGTYTVTVTDSMGTIIVDSVVVSQPNLLTVSIEAANDTICNGTNIYLNTYTNGGSAPYNYLWSTNSVDTLSSLNTYFNFSQFVEVSISDANNCTVADSIFITVQNPPLLVSSSDTCICLGNTATIIASGTPSYLWNTGDTTSVISVSPSTSTNYIVSYTDGICSVSDTTFVCVYPSISATVAIINSISCNGENDGAASVFVQGGIPPYSYLWLPGGSVNDSLFNLSTGIYTVSITDSSCNIVTDSITITEPNLLTVAVFAENDTVCLGNNIGLIATSNGGTLPYSYLWSTNIADTLSSVIADLNLSQFVEVSISDMNNCAAFDSIFITIQNPPLLVSTSDTCICFGDTALISASGVPSYFWNTGDSTATIIASPIVTTAFIVSYTDGICSVSDTTIVCVNPIPFVTASDDTSMAYNASVILNAFGDSPFYWSPSNSLSCNNCSSTIATPEISTTYTVAVTNAFGCSAKDTVNVEVYFYVITIPNIITPNNDAINDVFKIVGLPQNSIISIFNRWGNELLTSTNYQNNWATTTDGVYYYILNTPDGKFYNGAFQVNGN
jgi:gliding motility-associated-like protein